MVLGTGLGVVRLLVGVPMIIVTSLIIVLARLWPYPVRGATLAGWLTTYFTRLLLWIFGVQLICPDQHRLLAHEGFVFANHSSYADVFLFVALRPMRFLAAGEYLKMPFFGWAAKASGVIGVDRSSTRSRAQALLSLAKLERNPPIGLFPEGGIGPLYALQPFYHGAFKLCVENHIPYAVCAILFEHVDVVGWRDESIGAALWRLASAVQLQRARVEVLQVVNPAPESNPRQLAVEAHRAVAGCLGYAAKM